MMLFSPRKVGEFFPCIGIKKYFKLLPSMIKSGCLMQI